MTVRTASLILVLLLAANAAAQDDVRVEARLSSPEITEEETVQLIISISTAGNIDTNDIDIKLPPLPDFEQYEAQTSRQFSQVGNRISSIISIGYVLRPLRRGSIPIGSASVTVAGQTYVTEALNLVVTESRSGELIIVRQNPDRERVYVGEPIVVETQLYFRVRVLNYEVAEQPLVEGFVVEKDDTLQQVPMEEIEFNGQPYYRATLLRNIYFPLSPGTKEIKPLRLQVHYRDSGFSMNTKIARRDTNALRIEVKPLPERGRPEGFEGAVGRFDIDWHLNADSGAVNEPLTLSIALAGNGDIERAPEVKPQFPESFEIINTKTSGESGMSNGRWIGMRNWEIILIPSRAGEFTLGPLSYPYFNPETESYEVAAAEPITLTIAPPAASPRSAAAPEPSAAGGEFDIRYIKTPAGPLTDQGTPFYASPAFWALILVPLLINAVILAAVRLLKGGLGVDRESRRRKALTAAVRRLAGASGAGDPGAEIRAAVLGYFADKLKLEIAGLSINDVRAALVRADLHEHPLLEELTDVLHACDAARYAPEGSRASDSAALAGRAAKALDEMEELL